MSDKSKPSGGEPAAFDYEKFAHAFLARWGTEHAQVKRVLKKIEEPGFEYEDNILALEAKHLLENIVHTAQIAPGRFMVEFEGVAPVLNSDCEAAVEAYLRVFFCERGLAASYEASGEMFLERDTEFHGLSTTAGKVEPKAPYRTSSVFMSVDPANGRLAAEMQQAFTALTNEVRKRRPVEPDDAADGDTDEKGKNPVQPVEVKPTAPKQKWWEQE